MEPRGHRHSLTVATLALSRPPPTRMGPCHAQHGSPWCRRPTLWAQAPSPPYRRLKNTLNKPSYKLNQGHAAAPPCHHGRGPALQAVSIWGPLPGRQPARTLVSPRQGQQSWAARTRDVGHPAIKFLFIQHQPHAQGCARHRQLPSPGTPRRPPQSPGRDPSWGRPTWAAGQAAGQAVPLLQGSIRDFAAARSKAPFPARPQ